MRTLNLRWVQTDDDDAIDPCGDIVCGEEGCSNFQVIAQGVDRMYGEMIVRDVLARDALLSACKGAVNLMEPIARMYARTYRWEGTRWAEKIKGLKEAIALAEYPEWLTHLAEGNDAFK